MSEYLLITDSTCDLPSDIVEKENIIVMPMEYSLNEEDYIYSPYDNFNVDDFYNSLREGALVNTSQINFIKYCNFFEKYLENNLDILYISFSSSLSGTYNSSLMAIEELKDKYPDRIIKSIDSKAASGGEGLLVYLANKKKQEGLSLDELNDWILKNRDHICHWFTVDDLDYLYKGGRISKLSASIGSTLNIKPILHVNKEGLLVAKGKTRGRKKALKELVKQMGKTSINPKEQVIFIGHAGCMDDALYLKTLIEEKFNPEEIIINHIGPIIGSHTGPDTITLFFYGTEK